MATTKISTEKVENNADINLANKIENSSSPTTKVFRSSTDESNFKISWRAKIELMFHAIGDLFVSWTKAYRAKLKAGDTPLVAKKTLLDERVAHRRNSVSLEKINTMNRSPKGELKVANTDNYIIETRNLSKKYTNKSSIFSAISNVNIKIERGEFVVILGPSGSGKSTLLNVLSGLDRATSGDIIVNGTNISALKENELTNFRRETVGFIFQSYNLLPTLNVLENAKIGQYLQKDKMKRLDIDRVFKDIGMEGQELKRIDQISGGQQQRGSIARAISKNPLILFADEPTGALDETTGRMVLEVFENLNKKYKTTIIVVTHDTDIAKIASKIIRVRNNEIQSVDINTPIPVSQIWNE